MIKPTSSQYHFHAWIDRKSTDLVANEDFSDYEYSKNCRPQPVSCENLICHSRFVKNDFVSENILHILKK